MSLSAALAAPAGSSPVAPPRAGGRRRRAWLGLLELGHVTSVLGEKGLGGGDAEGARQAQLEPQALFLVCPAHGLDVGGHLVGRLHGLRRLGYLGLQLGDLLVSLGERRADLFVIWRAYLLGRFLPLLLVFGLRVALLPCPLFALRLRAIPIAVHGDRLPYPAGKEKACSRFHVGNRLLVRHKWDDAIYVST